MKSKEFQNPEMEVRIRQLVFLAIVITVFYSVFMKIKRWFKWK